VHARRAVFVAAGVLVVVAACGGNGDGPSARDVRSDPPPAAAEYCALVETFYERLGVLARRSASSEEFDARLIGFLREQQPLFERLAMVAPPEIQADAQTQADAFAEVARVGSTSPLETERARAAERRTVAYEEEACGIVVDDS
jgi:hypothetical protein